MTTWTALYEEPAEPVTATGDTPEEAVRRLQELLGEADDGEPLEIIRSESGLLIGDGPAIVGRIERSP